MQEQYEIIYCKGIIGKTRNSYTRVCLKNHSCNLHAPLCGIFCLHSVDVARYAALIQTKSPTNCDIYLAESIFKTHSRFDEFVWQLRHISSCILSSTMIE